VTSKYLGISNYFILYPLGSFESEHEAAREYDRYVVNHKLHKWLNLGARFFFVFAYYLLPPVFFFFSFLTCSIN